MVNIETFAERIAIQMKSINNEKTASIEVLKYGLLIFINLFSIVIASSLIGFITGEFVETLLALLVFALLRACTGGHHLKSSISCIFFSTIVLSVIPHITYSQIVTSILTIFSFILVVVFAPFGIENQTNIPKRFYPLLKIIGLVLITINLFVLSNTVASCFMLQSLMLIRRKGGVFYEKISSD